MKAKVLMVQGTSSSAGKSLLVAALCHIFARRGLRVVPFKAQNMSNNAAVCSNGAEIGRAQAVQALAAGVEPSADINPILIKPEADARSQVILMGRPFSTLSANTYYDHTQTLWSHVTAALDRLRASFDLVIAEGAGSPVEVNLKEGDIVNMAVARYANAAVLLVGDIDRGGIFAQLLGTLWLLEPEERALIGGLVINKFRGDLSLFADGVRILEERAGVPVLGVVPYLKDLALPEEDAVPLDSPEATRTESSAAVDIAVIHLPLISNFDDFDPFLEDAGVHVRYVKEPGALGEPDAVILPGTKSTMADLAWLRSVGLAQALSEYAQRGGALAGICGGYQMLGEIILDPQQVESQVERAEGLGLLPIQTRFESRKSTHQSLALLRAAPGWLASLRGQSIHGYEIHMGQTKCSSAWLEITSRNGKAVSVLDGAASPDGRIWGCYLHAIFANSNFRRAWLGSLGWVQEEMNPSSPQDLFAREIRRLADAVEAALDMRLLETILWDS